MFADALAIAILGMTVVALVLGLNYGLIYLIGLLRPREKPPAATPEPETAAPAPQEAEPPAAPSGQEPEDEALSQGEAVDPRTLAAITAALRAYEEELANTRHD